MPPDDKRPWWKFWARPAPTAKRPWWKFWAKG